MAGDGVLIEQLLEEVKERLTKIEEQNGVIIGHLEALEAEDEAEGSKDGRSQDAVQTLRGIASRDDIEARRQGVGLPERRSVR